MSHSIVGKLWSDLGFDPMINQRLLPPTLPRYTKIKSNVDSFHYFELLLHRLKQALKITTYSSFHEALVSLVLANQKKSVKGGKIIA